MTIVHVVSAIAGLFGVLFLVFAFVEPPRALGPLFRAPASILPEKVGQVVFGLALLAVSVFASAVVPMFIK
jgi:hypothetical protein